LIQKDEKIKSKWSFHPRHDFAFADPLAGVPTQNHSRLRRPGLLWLALAIC